MDPGGVEVQLPACEGDRSSRSLASRTCRCSKMRWRVIVERTGTIVMGEGVRISTVAISHGNLVLQVEADQIVQPQALAEGETAVQNNEKVTVTEQAPSLAVVKQAQPSAGWCGRSTRGR